MTASASARRLAAAKAALAQRVIANRALDGVVEAVGREVKGTPGHYVALNAARATMGLSRLSETEYAGMNWEAR